MRKKSRRGGGRVDDAKSTTKTKTSRFVERGGGFGVAAAMCIRAPRARLVIRTVAARASCTTIRANRAWRCRRHPVRKER